MSTQAYYRWVHQGKPLHRCYDEQRTDRIQNLFDREKKGDRYIRAQILRLDHQRIKSTLVQRFEALRLHEKLVFDLSYVYHKGSRLYLNVLKELNANSFVLLCLDQVIDSAWDSIQVCILRSDQGFQYTNRSDVERLDACGVTILHS